MARVSTSAPAPGYDCSARVYYEDTDAGGVVYYANYLKYFERARTEWLRSLGVSQQAMSEQEGLMFIVRSTAMDYHAPARLDDLLTIHSRLLRIGRVIIEFEQQAWRGNVTSGELLVTGQIKVGCVDRQSLRPAAYPAALHAQLERFSPPTKIKA